MITVLGKRVLKNAIRIEKPTESVADVEYTVIVQTKGVSNPEETLRVARDKLKEKFGITVLYGEVVDDKIMLQVKATTQFVWGAVIAFLPQILSIVGVVVALITVYLMASSIPTWAWGLGAFALAVLFVVPKVLPKITGGEE